MGYLAYQTKTIKLRKVKIMHLNYRDYLTDILLQVEDQEYSKAVSYDWKAHWLNYDSVTYALYMFRKDE